MSALDVSIRSQILNLLNALKRDRGLTYLFISHNLAVVKYVADTVAVMNLGRIVEMGAAENLYADPKHPYTRTLIAAIPRMTPGTGAAESLPAGDLPNPESPPGGCAFHPRCPHATDKCRSTPPLLAARGGLPPARLIAPRDQWPASRLAWGSDSSAERSVASACA